jgi:excisionase family DNA binding protein
MDRTNLVTVPEAARLLGISEGAVRARIHRGTLETERDGGTVYVRIDDENMSNERTEQSELVEELRKHNTALQHQLDAERDASAELRRIIAGLVQRIPPELEPAKEPASEQGESPVTASEEGGKGQVPSEAKAESEPWWRRIFR